MKLRLNRLSPVKLMTHPATPEPLAVLHIMAHGSSMASLDLAAASELALDAARHEPLHVDAWSQMTMDDELAGAAARTVAYLAHHAAAAIIESRDIFYRLTNTRFLREL